MPSTRLPKTEEDSGVFFNGESLSALLKLSTVFIMIYTVYTHYTQLTRGKKKSFRGKNEHVHNVLQSIKDKIPQRRGLYDEKNTFIMRRFHRGL